MTHKISMKAMFAPVMVSLGLVACQPADDNAVQYDQAAIDAAIWPHEISDILPDPAVRYGQMENGMRYAIMVNETPPNVASVRMVFNMGSLGESEDQLGLAHFIEHMAFNGTTNIPEGEMVALLERSGLAFGADTNAFTGRETVGYQLDLPETDDESIDTALFLMRETASEMLLDPEAIDRERGVVLSEERFRNTPIRRWLSALTRFRFPHTIIADRDAIGTVEILETAQRDRFVDYYENFYIPQRGIVVVTGDFDPDAIEAKILDVFSDWQGPEEMRPDPDLGTIDLERPFSVGYLNDPELYTILTVDAIHDHEFILDTAENRFQGFLVSIGESIVNQRFATIVNTGTSPLLQAGVSSTTDYNLVDRGSMLTVATPDRWEEALAISEQEVRRALEHGFTQTELNEQMSNWRTGLENQVDQVGTRDSANLADAIWGSWRYDSVFSHPTSALERFEANADRVTVEAINAAFSEIWTDTEKLIFLATSLEISDAESVIRDTWNASLEVAVDAPIDNGVVEFAYTDFGPAGAIAEREETEDLGVVHTRFENGIVVNFKQTDFEDGIIHLRVHFGRGELEPRALPVVDVLTSATFTASGLGAHSSDELRRVLAGRSVGVGFSVQEDTFSLGGSTTPDDLLLELQLMAAYMSDPGWREEGLAQYRLSAPELRRNMYSSPNGVLRAEVSRMIRNGDTRYGNPDPEEVAGIDIDAMRAFLTPSLENAPIEITVVGDISEADAMAAIAATFGAFPERETLWSQYPEARTITFPDPVTEPIIIRHNGPDYQAMVNIYWPTDDDGDRRKTRTISMLRRIFDLKLTETLREEDGVTYSARNSSTSSSAYPDYGYMYVGVDIQLENVDHTLSRIEELAAELAAGGISDDELLRARRPWLEQIEEGFESNGWWTFWLAQTTPMEDRLEGIRTLVSDYESFTREELVAVANEYLKPETAYRVTILPQETE